MSRSVSDFWKQITISVLSAIFQVSLDQLVPRGFLPLLREKNLWALVTRVLEWAGCPSFYPSNSVRTLKETQLASSFLQPPPEGNRVASFTLALRYQ